MLLQPEIREHAIGDARNRGAINGIAVIKRDCQVVDRLLDAIRLVRCCAHENARGSRVVGREVSRFDPIDPIRRRAVFARLQVANEPGEAASFRDLANHPILRIAARISSSVACS